MRPAPRSAPAALVWDAPVTPDTLSRLVETSGGGRLDVEITPELARAMLAYNTHNRSMRPFRVQFFVTVLRQGRWINTGEPIIFSRAALNEGQHRLQAIADTGISARLDLRFGIEERAFEVTGTGATRTAGDTLSILGVPSHNAVAAQLKLLLAYDAGITSGNAIRSRVGGDEIVAAYRRWPDCLEGVRLMQTYLGRQDVGLHCCAGSAFAFLALRQKNPGPVGDFLFSVGMGAAGHVDDSARLLRDRLILDPRLRHSSRDANVLKLALFIEAWTAWLSGERPTTLTWKPGLPFPKMAGVTL